MTDPVVCRYLIGGSGTTGLVAVEQGRNATLIDLDERNAVLARERIPDGFWHTFGVVG